MQNVYCPSRGTAAPPPSQSRKILSLVHVFFYRELVGATHSKALNLLRAFIECAVGEKHVKLLASRFELRELFRRLRKRKPPAEEDATETAAYERRTTLFVNPSHDHFNEAYIG